MMSKPRTLRSYRNEQSDSPKSCPGAVDKSQAPLRELIHLSLRAQTKP